MSAAEELQTIRFQCAPLRPTLPPFVPPGPRGAASGPESRSASARDPRSSRRPRPPGKLWAPPPRPPPMPAEALLLSFLLPVLLPCPLLETLPPFARSHHRSHLPSNPTSVALLPAGIENRAVIGRTNSDDDGSQPAQPVPLVPPPRPVAAANHTELRRISTHDLFQIGSLGVHRLRCTPREPKSSPRKRAEKVLSLAPCPSKTAFCAQRPPSFFVVYLCLLFCPCYQIPPLATRGTQVQSCRPQAFRLTVLQDDKKMISLFSPTVSVEPFRLCQPFPLQWRQIRSP